MFFKWLYESDIIGFAKLAANSDAQIFLLRKKIDGLKEIVKLGFMAVVILIVLVMLK